MSNFGFIIVMLIAFLTAYAFGWAFYDLNYKISTYDTPYEKTITIREKYDGFIITSDSEKYKFSDNNDKCFLTSRIGQIYNYTLKHRPYDNAIFVIEC